MTARRRLVSFLLFFSLALLLGFLFPSLVRNYLVAPVSLVVWLLVRVFVLTIDQQIYWVVLIFVALFFLSRRFQEGTAAAGQPPLWEANTALENLKTWRSTIRFTGSQVEYQNTVKRELAKLLVNLHASQMTGSVFYQVYDDLKQGRIPLPGGIQTFLFAGEPSEPGPVLPRVLNAIRRAPAQWMRRVTGRDEADYYRSVDEVLEYLDGGQT
jgi:hypothetical protein